MYFFFIMAGHVKRPWNLNAGEVSVDQKSGNKITGQRDFGDVRLMRNLSTMALMLEPML